MDPNTGWQTSKSLFAHEIINVVDKSPAQQLQPLSYSPHNTTTTTASHTHTHTHTYTHTHTHTLMHRQTQMSLLVQLMALDSLLMTGLLAVHEYNKTNLTCFYFLSFCTGLQVVTLNLHWTQARTSQMQWLQLKMV